MDTSGIPDTGLARGGVALAGTSNDLRDFVVDPLAPQPAFLWRAGVIEGDFVEDAEFASLREMGADADVALAANKAYQAEILRAMDRVDAARKRIGELEVRVKRSGELRRRRRWLTASGSTDPPHLPFRLSRRD
jgi:hypothetical protein